jgi:predicted ArsR family transcriptional regulator
VRRHILEILKARNGATVAELAETLEMAAVSVRHHLDILQGDNLIRVERTARSGAVGRPQQVYALTDEAAELFPNNFAALAGSLVRQVKHLLPPEQVEGLFRALANDLAQEFLHEQQGAQGTADLAALPAEERVRRVADFLNARGYLASYERAPGVAPEGIGDAAQSYLVHKHNCPYAGVSGEHDELCLMDQALVDALFGQRCQRIAHMGAEGHCCTYRVDVDRDDVHCVDVSADLDAARPAGCACAGEPAALPVRSAISLVA